MPRLPRLPEPNWEAWLADAAERVIDDQELALACADPKGGRARWAALRAEAIHIADRAARRGTSSSPETDRTDRKDPGPHTGRGPSGDAA